MNLVLFALQVIHRARWIILLAISQHITVAVLLMASPSVMGVSSVSLIGQIAGGRVAVIDALMVAAVGASYSLLVDKPHAHFFAIPQQFILFITAFGAVSVSLAGMYADGVPRPREFIAADQSIFVWLFIWHLIALLEMFGLFDLLETWIRSRSR